MHHCPKCGKFMRVQIAVDNGCTVLAGRCQPCGITVILDVSFKGRPRSHIVRMR